MNFALLSLAAADRQNANGAVVLLIQLVLFGLIFYWLLIRPQRQEQARLRKMVEELKKGDEVLLNGGIIGTVVHLKETRLILKTGESKVEADRGRVAAVLTAPAEVGTKE